MGDRKTHWTKSYGRLRGAVYRWLDRQGWENYANTPKRVTMWLPPGSSPVECCSTKRAVWLSVTAQTKRVGGPS